MAKPTRTTLRLQVPDDYLLHRDCCSYGYFLLHPNHWDVKRRVFSRVLSIGGVAGARSELSPHAVHIAISQKPASGDVAANAGSALTVRVEGLATSAGDTTRSRALAYEQIRAQITRMLRLDESAETIARFHAVDPRWKESGRGRVFRSPTLFEDVVKTVTSCNVQWPGTIQMNKRLCEVVGAKVKLADSKANTPAASGGRAFPLPGPLSRTRPATLRARCRVGYRDQRIVDLAKLFATRPEKGGVDQRALESPATSDDQVWDMLLELPGVGPYAAANIMQLLGRYARLPLDTESVRHARTVLGYTGASRDIMKRLHHHYAPFGVDAFRSYWFELWEFYERKHGRAWTWERDSTGKVFTAALLST